MAAGVAVAGAGGTDEAPAKPAAAGTVATPTPAAADRSAAPGPAAPLFAKRVWYPTGDHAPCSLAAGDFDGDGRMDLAGTTGTIPAVLLLRGDGKGAFERGRFAPTTERVCGGILAADLEGDGDPDLLTRSGEDTIVILTNDGKGRFREARLDLPEVRVRFWFGMGRPQLADLDSDGRLDLVAALEDRVMVVWNKPRGWRFGTLATSTADDSGTVAVGDVDGDADPDIVQGSGHLGALRILTNGGSGKFTATSRVATGVKPSTPSRHLGCDGDVCRIHVATTSQPMLADADGDGHLDLLVLHELTPGVTLLRGDGAGGYGAPERVGRPLRHLERVLVADLDGDGRTDLLAWGRSKPRKVAVIAGLAGGGFDQPVLYPAASKNIGGLALLDADGDGDQDLAVSEGQWRNINVVRNTSKLRP